MSSNAAKLMNSSAAPAMNSNAPHLMNSNALHLTRPPMRRSAPPLTSKSAPALAMEDTAKEVLDMELSNLAPKFPSKAAQVCQYKNLFRNALLYPRRVASRWLSRHQESPAPQCQSRTINKSPSRIVPRCPRRAAPVFQYKHQPRWPRKSAVEVVVDMVEVDTMVRVMIGWLIHYTLQIVASNLNMNLTL